MDELIAATDLTPSEGLGAIRFNGSDSTPDGVISQIIVTIPGQLYHFSFDLGVLAYTTDTMGLQVDVDGTESLFSHLFWFPRYPVYQTG